MNHMFRTWAARFGVLAAAGALVVGAAPAASAQNGTSTPGVTVTAQNPGTSPSGSDLRITLTAHTEKKAVETSDCRPTAPTIECWGSLVLRIPAADDLSVTGFQVHRVAVGDITCGEDEGDCGGDDGGDCGGDDGGDCGGSGMAATTAVGVEQFLQAQVNGVAVLSDPGNSGLDKGTEVQVKITLTDNGTAQYVDTAAVQVNEFVEGPDKPQIYPPNGQAPQPQLVQQVQIHLEGNSG